MNTNGQSLTCPSCQAANNAGVKFCAECGASLAARAIGTTVPASIPGAVPTETMGWVRDALTRANAVVTGGDGQTTLDYQLTFSDRLIGPMPLEFAGTVTQPAGGSSAHTVTARMMPKSLAIMFGMLVSGIVLLGFMPRSLISNDMFYGVAAVTLGVTLWVVFAEGPKRVRRHVEALIAPAAATAPVATQGPAPVASPTPAGGDVFAQLERLAQLQATGLLTADDVATKKAELLQRI